MPAAVSTRRSPCRFGGHNVQDHAVVAPVVVMAVRTAVRLPDMDLDIAATSHPIVTLDDRVGEFGAE